MAGFFPTGSPLLGNRANVDADFYYSYSWDILDLFEQGGSKDAYTIGQVDQSRLITIFAESCSLPTIQFTKEKIPGGSLEYNFAKSVSFDDIKIVFNDTLGLSKILDEWQARVWSSEKGLRPPGLYKRTSRIIQYLPTVPGAGINSNDPGNLNGIVVYNLYGSWPSTINSGDLTYKTDEVKKVTVTITYDHCKKTYEV